MAIDLEMRRVVFDLNGEYQGGDSISKEPMWIIASVCSRADKIEVNRSPPCEMPLESRSRLLSGDFTPPFEESEEEADFDLFS